ncbi:MAG: DUF6151 family protein [Pseudoruegeria sp.]
MSDLPLSCQCGSVKGVAKNVSKKSCNRVVCYCSDCQAFANNIGAGARVLNEHGGTELVQLAPSDVRLTKGRDHIACLRFSDKGPFRWYASCCNTPIANTAKPNFPFVGLSHAFIEMNAMTKDAKIGPVRWHCQTQDAADSWPSDQKRNGFPIGLSFRMIGLIAGWKLRGLGHPNPLFSNDNEPIVEPRLVDRKIL